MARPLATLGVLGSPWPTPISIDLSGIDADASIDRLESRLRARPGVAVLWPELEHRSSPGEIAKPCQSPKPGRGAKPLLVSACGDLRGFVTGRLRSDGPRADLSSVVSRVTACECGSGFEADLAQASIARLLLPEAFERVAARRGVFFVHLDPAARTPVTRVIAGAETREPVSAASLLGPFARRSHAELFAGLLDTRFSLCREPGIFARFPNAEACAYKEMGACPAPCDGSEPIERYRERAARASVFDGPSARAALDLLDAEMTRLAGEMNFERAAGLKPEREILARSLSAGSASSAWVRRMDRFGVLAIMPSGKVGWARLFVCVGGVVRVLGDISARQADPAGAIGEMLGRVTTASAAGSDFGLEHFDGVAMVHRALQSGKKTRGRLFALEPMPSKADLTRAVVRAARVATDPAAVVDPSDAAGIEARGEGEARGETES